MRAVVRRGTYLQVGWMVADVWGLVAFTGSLARTRFIRRRPSHKGRSLLAERRVKAVSPAQRGRAKREP
jgi:hypothetical protein